MQNCWYAICPPLVFPFSSCCHPGHSCTPAASVPRQACHGTGVFIAQAWRRCDCTPYPRQFKGALQAAFAA